MPGGRIIVRIGRGIFSYHGGVAVMASGTSAQSALHFPAPARTPVDELALMALQKPEIEARLADERRQPEINAAVIAALEFWLAAYQHRVSHARRFVGHAAHTAPKD